MTPAHYLVKESRRSRNGRMTTFHLQTGILVIQMLLFCLPEGNKSVNYCLYSEGRLPQFRDFIHSKGKNDAYGTSQTIINPLSVN